MTDSLSALRTVRVVWVLSVVVLTAQAACWVWAAPILRACLSVRSGDALIGVYVVAVYSIGFGIAAAAFSLPLAIIGRKLPVWMRGLLIASPAAAIAIGLLLFL